MEESSETLLVDPKKLLSFAKDEDLYFSSLVEFMNRVPSQIIEGRSVTEWFRLRDHSLWWFAHVFLWPHIDEHIRFVIDFKNMLDIIGPDIVELRGFHEKAHLIQQICRNENVNLSIGLSSRIKILEKKISRKIRLKASRLITRKKKAKRIALAREAKHHGIETIKKGCVIHVWHETYRRSIYDFETGNISDGEYLAQKILEKLKKRGVDLLGIDVDHTSRGELLALTRRINDKDQYWLPLEILEDRKLKDSELEKSIQDTKSKLSTLFRNSSFQDIFKFNDTSLWNTLSVNFESLLIDRALPQMIRDIQTIKHVLETLLPKSVFLLYEKGPSAMSFIIAADELGIKTVGMQHGMIYEWHPDYAISELRSNDSILGSPIPTVTVVFGQFFRELLTEKLAYPSNRVVVVGNPTYEGANIGSKQLDKRSVLIRLSLDQSKKIVLVASSMGQKKHGQPEYDVIMIETLARSFANSDDLQVVIKLHPKEDGTVYRRIIEERKASNFVIVDHPIEELIQICDVFLAVATTTIFEAIALQKPVIIVQAFGKVNKHVVELLEKGVALDARFEELAEKVLEVMNKKEIAEELKLRASEFANHYFNLPGNEISEKIADILTDPERDN